MTTRPATYKASAVNRCHLHETEARWFAVYTPFRREKSAMRELEKRGIEAYVPLVERVKKYERKIKTYHVPLINNYVFVRICKKDYVEVLRSRDVIHFLRFDGGIIAIPQEEIFLLQRIVGEASDVQAANRRPSVGQRVEIIAGKLTGITGVVREEKGKHQVLVDLETLGWSLQVEVHPKYLQPVM